MIRDKNLVFLCLLQTLLYLGVFPVCARIKHLIVYYLSCRVDRVERDARFVRYIWREHYPLPLEDFGMNLEKNRVDNPACFTSSKLHWMI